MEKIELRCKLKQKTLKKNFTVLLKKKNYNGVSNFLCKAMSQRLLFLYCVISFYIFCIKYTV